MKLIERNSGRVVNIIMHMMDDDKIHSGNDISADFFADAQAEYSGDTMIVDDVDYCVEYAKDWVDGTGDFYGSDDLWRRAEINGELYTNYGL